MKIQHSTSFPVCCILNLFSTGSEPCSPEPCTARKEGCNLTKRIAALLVVLAMLPAMAACGGAVSAETDWTPAQMAEAIWNSQTPAAAVPLLPGNAVYDVLLTDSYLLDTAAVEDGAVWTSAATAAQEIAVLRLADPADADTVQAALEAYLTARAAVFFGYMPDEAAILEASSVAVRGPYVALLACSDVSAAEAAFERCFTEAPPETAPAEALPSAGGGANASDDAAPLPAPGQDGEAADGRDDSTDVSLPSGDDTGQGDAPDPSGTDTDAAIPLPWSYDEDRLLAAWEAGDWSQLAEEDQQILDVCSQVLAGITAAYETDYARELAVHDWMLANGRYDNDTLSTWTEEQASPNNENPYGFLVDGVGICYGYASTFQLFMRLLGIECITVEGTAYGYTTPHAWNQVQLDGEWYCVDVTWDDPTVSYTVSDAAAHRYFNATGDFFRSTDHQWDEDAVPAAEGTAYAWQ